MLRRTPPDCQFGHRGLKNSSFLLIPKLARGRAIAVAACSIMAHSPAGSFRFSKESQASAQFRASARWPHAFTRRHSQQPDFYGTAERAFCTARRGIRHRCTPLILTSPNAPPLSWPQIKVFWCRISSSPIAPVHWELFGAHPVSRPFPGHISEQVGIFRRHSGRVVVL